MKLFSLIFLLLFSFNIHAKEITIQLENAGINRHDMSSIKRGAQFFASHCMSCHTLIYLRYDPLSQKAGITYERMPVNVKNWPNNVKPPDLSLEASAKGADWIYTYLHSFYIDRKSPTGFNNLLVPNSVMPDILSPLQGEQVLSQDLSSSPMIFHSDWQWYDLVTLQKKGSMDEKQFDDTITDVTNFLEYASEPFYEEQFRLGFWVLGFLVLFFILIFLLKKEYWKDIQ